MIYINKRYIFWFVLFIQNPFTFNGRSTIYIYVCVWTREQYLSLLYLHLNTEFNKYLKMQPIVMWLVSTWHWIQNTLPNLLSSLQSPSNITKRGPASFCTVLFYDDRIIIIIEIAITRIVLIKFYYCIIYRKLYEKY